MDKKTESNAAATIKTLCEKINASPFLQSLLYDIDLLPEQIKDDDLRRWGYVEAIVGHFESAAAHPDDGSCEVGARA